MTWAYLFCVAKVKLVFMAALVNVMVLDFRIRVMQLK